MLKEGMENDLELPHKFVTWVQTLDNTKQYKDTLQPAFDFSTIKEFWAFYQHMARPPKLKENQYIYIFKDGIHPSWEAAENEDGGCFRVKLKKTKSSRNWEDLILMFISPNNLHLKVINGVRLKVKEKFDEVELWVQKMEEDRIKILKDYIKKVGLNDEDAIVEYKNWKK